MYCILSSVSVVGFCLYQFNPGRCASQVFEIIFLLGSPKFNKKEKRILHLRYLIPISLALIDTVIISVWAGFDPIEYAIKVVRSGERDPPFHRIAFCDFRVNIPFGVLLCIKVVVLFLSVFLAYHLRKVTHKSQRYTFVISLMVYTTLFFSIFINSMSFRSAAIVFLSSSVSSGYTSQV